MNLVIVLVLLGILCFILLGAFVAKWLFIIAAIIAVAWVISLLLGGRRL